tara:strand:+ start:703 stop:1212 length:510 start_codon:yes stop_codon:yes gene_type:complete
MRLMLTGHRPHKLGGYNNSEVQNRIELKLAEVLDRANKLAHQKGKELTVLTGMALGADQIWAKAAMLKGVKVIAFVPFAGQENKWPQHAREHYYDLLSKCHKVVYCSKAGYAAWKLHKRDKDMVNNADYCIAVWDGNSGSGTANTVLYAKQENKPLLHIHPFSLDERWL